MTDQLLSFALFLTFFLSFGFFIGVLAILSPTRYDR